MHSLINKTFLHRFYVHRLIANYIYKNFLFLSGYWYKKLRPLWQRNLPVHLSGSLASGAIGDCELGMVLQEIGFHLTMHTHCMDYSIIFCYSRRTGDFSLLSVRDDCDRTDIFLLIVNNHFRMVQTCKWSHIQFNFVMSRIKAICVITMFKY